jgi:hypothetical protein
LLKIKAFVLFVMYLFTQFTVAEEGSCLSAISSSEAEKVESSEVNTSNGVEGTISYAGPGLRAVEGDLKASYMGGHTFSLVKAVCSWSNCGAYQQCYQTIVFLYVLQYRWLLGRLRFQF